MYLIVGIVEGDLQDGMRTGGIHIGAILGRHSDSCAELDYLHEVVDGYDFSLG